MSIKSDDSDRKSKASKQDLLNLKVPKDTLSYAYEKLSPEISNFQFLSFNIDDSPSRINKDIHYQLGE